MEGLLELARGPLFRLTFAIMVLGMLRVLVLDVIAIYGTWRKAGDKSMPWGLITRRTFEWMVPVKRVFNNRPLYSILSMLFHVGLLLVPIFLLAHVQLWEAALGFGWPTLPEGLADGLTLLTIVTAVALVIGRFASASSSAISRKQDYFWPILLAIPFATGYVCANLALSVSSYKTFMLIHILSSELIFVLMPFTKIAHCMLMPLSQVVCTLAWKFPPKTDDDVCTTLDKKGAPV